MKPCRAGFSLVELLGATALAALLMAAVLAVTAAGAASRQTLEQRAETGWPPQLLELLRWDLSHAQAIDTEGGVIVLQSLAALDPATLTALHRPAEIRYQVLAEPGAERDAGGRARWLVRTQTLLDARRPEQAVWRELVSDQVKAMRLPEVELPDRVRLVLEPADGTRTELDQWIFLP